MTNKFDGIPNGDLFKDLNETQTEILLCELIQDEKMKKKYEKRLADNTNILNTIIKIMKNRFDDHEIDKFLEVGYPRSVNLGRVIS